LKAWSLDDFSAMRKKRNMKKPWVELKMVKSIAVELLAETRTVNAA
jgi:hypothetical protein